MGRAFEYRRASKEKRWDKMSKIFPKLARTITMAVKAGGSDPASNATLRTAIQNAKAESMPKDNIDKAIKRADGSDVEDWAEVNYEAKAGNGVLIFIETATNNLNRTIANLRTIMGKNGAEMVPNGSLEFMFARKTVIQFPVADGMDLEELELELIDHGLEEMTVNDGTAYLQGDFTAFGALTAAIEKMEIEGVKSKLERIPTSPIEITEAQLEEVETLIDKIEDDEDVQSVYTNIA